MGQNLLSAISHDGSIYVLLEKWCSMDPINKNPSHVSIHIPAPAGSVMGYDWGYNHPSGNLAASHGDDSPL